MCLHHAIDIPRHTAIAGVCHMVVVVVGVDGHGVEGNP